MDSLELTPAQEKSLRRHWAGKGEYMTVLSGGVKKRVKTTSILNVMKDRTNEMRRRVETVPLQLMDLGSIGVRWVRALPELLRRYASIKPKVEPQSGTLSSDHRGALKTLAQLLEHEDGYAIARAVKPRLVESQALTVPTSDYIKLEKRGGASGKVRVEMRLVVGAEPADAMVHVGSHTYGEVDLEGFAEVLMSVAPQPGEIFVDLGSGTGRAVFCAAAIAPWKRVVGVEFVRDLHNSGLRMAADFKAKVPNPETWRLLPARDSLHQACDFGHMLCDHHVVFPPPQ